MSSSFRDNRNWNGGLLLASTMLCFALTSVTQAATIQFRSQSSVSTDVVTLGDVATVYDLNPQVAVRLQQIVLRPAPPAGVKIRLSVDEIRSRLKASGVNMLAVEMQGSSTIEVMSSAASSPIQQASYTAPNPEANARQLQQAAKALKQAIQQYLKSQKIEAKIEQIELEVSKQDIRLLKFNSAAAYHVQGGQAPWSAPQHLKISLLDDNQAMQTMVVIVTVKSGPTALVPRYQIPRGQALTVDDFEFVPVDRLSVNMLTTYEEIEGKEAVQPLAAGRPVLETQLKPLVLVRRNAMVKVHARVGGVEVNSYFKALKDGSHGDLIQVEPQWKTKTRPTPINVRINGVNEAVVDTGSASASR
ncbi:flagellar basal body P-ring biosynthesis protein FlgA [Polystyrenella longa]|uniref:Flagellar basal body P-ring biosynthesis protein FlgA n=1 Tax=Polystyrenella longa TaxID=2528007 RepID=A0A518CIS1_9PLAN|nr:flagellar basal body P-ring formation chaperone FlgA [Polystyrenella longa]QDU79135.1 flagellar basal body P-ring biosynthesis protein FlgA [Polystyrenella longa]